MRLAGGSRREIQRIGLRLAPTAQSQGPQAVDHQRLAIGAVQLVDEMPVLVEYIYSAVAEVADEDVAAEPAEGIRRTGDAPRRIERPAADQASQQMAVSIEHVDKAVALARYVVVLLRVLHRVRHEEIAIDIRYAEGRVACRDPGVLEITVGRRGRE